MAALTHATAHASLSAIPQTRAEQNWKKLFRLIKERLPTLKAMAKSEALIPPYAMQLVKELRQEAGAPIPPSSHLIRITRISIVRITFNFKDCS